jgi:ABC-2 type transport system ATP-binding protein
VTFEVTHGQLLAILGPNGAGKTTTLEMLEGFAAPTSGTVRVLGADPHRAGRAWRARIGLVLQSTSLDSEFTVADTLRLFARLYPAPRRVREVLDLVDLRSDAQTRVGVLSGGQRRRVDIAIGVIGRPEVLFLDEPTTGLDPEARRHTWASIENLTSAGTTVLLTTHYIDEADHLADRVIVLADGRLGADLDHDIEFAHIQLGLLPEPDLYVTRLRRPSPRVLLGSRPLRQQPLAVAHQGEAGPSRPPSRRRSHRLAACHQSR